MKLIVLCTIISLQATAASYAQQITLNYKNAPLREVLQSIRKQSGYYFFFVSDYLDKAKPVSVSVKDVSLEETLVIVFAGQPFEYAVKGKMITIRPAEKSAVDKVVDFFSVITVRGKVMDEEGNPLPGVSVILKEQNSKVAVTDPQGNFSFKDVPNRGTLLLRMIGRETKEISYVDERLLTVVLKQADADLNEIQVIAYGTVDKQYNTSNMGTIKGKDIQNQPVSNLQLTLAGRVPGMFVRQNSGLSSSLVDITIQGRNSLSNGSAPFYVIDGIPYSPQFTGSSLMGDAVYGAGGNAFDFINPADIESISILKDADATAIYGSRAANGAILITTRKGKPGRTQVDVSFRNGWGKITRTLDMLNTEQYLELRKEAYVNAGQTVPATEQEANWTNFDLTFWDQHRYTNWQKELVNETALFTNLQATISGGSEQTQFTAAYGYTNETTVYYGKPGNKKGNVHFNLNHSSIDNRFKYVLSGGYLMGKNNLYNADLSRAALLTAPNAPAMYNADGSVNFAPTNITHETSFEYNPAIVIGIPFNGNTSNLIANNTISYELISGLQLKVSAGINRLAGDETKFQPSTIVRPEYPDNIRIAQYLTKSTKSWIVEPQITYQKSTHVGNFDLLLGGSVQQMRSEALLQTGSGHASDAQLGDIGAAAVLTTDDVSKKLYRYNALFGRFNYRLMGKYIINFTARRDGSSRFGDENKLHNFYSVGGAWLFGSEEIIKQHAGWLSSGKIRINYGTTGNDQISDFRYLSVFQNIGVSIPYLQTVGIRPNNIANPYLQWEETRKMNIGLDLVFLADRIQVTANYFRNRSSNQLIRYDLPSVAGFGSIDRNFPATVQNTGLELQIDATPIRNKEFSWRTSANITLPRNKIVSFPGIEKTTYSQQYIVGRSMNLLRAYRYAGVNSTTGLYEFYTTKGEKTSSPNSLEDKTELIDINPKFYGGLSNSIEFKGFSLDILFQFVKQHGFAYRFGNAVGAFNANQPTYVLNRWRKEGDVAQIQKASVGSDVWGPADAAAQSDEAYTDASFIRLKNASLSYTLPDEWLKRAHITRARLFMQGQNLWTITKFVGTDPETQNFGSLPPLRVMTLGLQLTL